MKDGHWYCYLYRGYLLEQTDAQRACIHFCIQLQVIYRLNNVTLNLEMCFYYPNPYSNIQWYSVKLADSNRRWSTSTPTYFLLFGDRSYRIVRFRFNDEFCASFRKHRWIKGPREFCQRFRELISVLVKFVSLSQVISFVSMLDAIHRHDFSYNLL